MKYKTLKELPGMPTGTIIVKTCLGYYFAGLQFDQTEMDAYPEWFEPVIERWEPKEGEEYFYIAIERGRNTQCLFRWEKETFKTEQRHDEAYDAIKKVLDELHRKWGE